MLTTLKRFAFLVSSDEFLLIHKKEVASFTRQRKLPPKILSETARSYNFVKSLGEDLLTNWSLNNELSGGSQRVGDHRRAQNRIW